MTIATIGCSGAALLAHSGLLNSPCVTSVVNIVSSEPRPRVVNLPYSSELVGVVLDLAYLGKRTYYTRLVSSCDQHSLLDCLNFLGSELTIETYQDVVGEYLKDALACTGQPDLMDILPYGADHRAAGAGFVADAATALMCFPSTPYNVTQVCHNIARRAFVTRTSSGAHPMDAEKSPDEDTIFWGDVAASDTWNRLDALTLAAILCKNRRASAHLTFDHPIVMTPSEDIADQEFVIGGAWAVGVKYVDECVKVFLRRPADDMHSSIRESCECTMHILASSQTGSGYVVDPDGASPTHACCMLANGEEACVVDWSDVKIVEITVSRVRISRC